MQGIVTEASVNEVAGHIESVKYIEKYIEYQKKFIPFIDFSDAAQFAKFGSAEDYYRKGIEYIYKYYPYDGSLLEKLKWHASGTFLDNYIFENEYPRTTGYVSLGATWKDTPGTAKTVSSETFYKSSKPNYISIFGGPHAASLPHYDRSATTPDYKIPEHKANVYSVEDYREANLMIDGARGNTIEFWFKAGDSDATINKYLGESHCFAYFDLWNGITVASSQSANYGRFLVEGRRGTSGYNTFQDDKLFYVTYMSGGTGIDRTGIGTATDIIATNPLYNWNHFAFTVGNNSSNLDLKLYVNGVLNETVQTTGDNSTVGKVTDVGTDEGMNAYLGAYRTAPTKASLDGGVGAGYGGVSGSLDEFRFWKTTRTSKKISDYWFAQVAGGTNTDVANVGLGVYYKFNEGITTADSVDSVVLDSAGRVSNGTFVNYDSALAHSMRSTNSAMEESAATTAEFKDPILYPWHSDVDDYLNTSLEKGQLWDNQNPSLLYHHFPFWITSQDTDYGGELRSLIHIMASYFDSLYLQIQALPFLKSIRYPSTSKVNDAPSSFISRLLNSSGFATSEIFVDAEVLEQFASRDDKRKFTNKLKDIKNLIYQNIYNNLIYFNKSKGTEKSIRNFLHCFGIDEDAYRLFIYTQNSTFTFDNKLKYSSVRKKYIDFNHVDRNSAIVMQYTSSANTNSVSFVTASNKTSDGFDTELGATYEVEAIFPKKPDIKKRDIYSFFHFSNLTSSVCGAHTVPTDSSGTNMYQWASTTTFTFGASSFNDVDNATLTLTSTDGTAVTYKIKNGDSTSADSESQEFDAGSSNSNAASDFVLLVNGKNGHNGKIGAIDDGDGKIILVQAVAGTAGDKAATTSGWNTITSTNISNFSGGIDDPGSFQVVAVRDAINTPDGRVNSPNVYFKLVSQDYGTAGGGVIPTLTSPLFYDVYDDKKWNFAVRVSPKKYPHVSYISGSSDNVDDATSGGSTTGNNYLVEFYGVHMIYETVIDEFHVTEEISNDSGKKFITAPKTTLCWCE